MKVKYINLVKQFEHFEKNEELRKIFQECQFILGPKVGEFEEQFARLCKVPYAVGVNSGTDALFLAMKAAGLGPGDEVITAPNSFIATAGSIVATGAKPVFVDVGQDYNIDVNLIEKAITKKTKAILPVHLTGNPADMDHIMSLAEKYKLAVIEDAAQAVGAEYKRMPVGSFGIGCFSLHPLKNLNVCGDGGVITTPSEDIYNRLRLLRNHGLANREESVIFGYCSRLDSIHAAIALGGLRHLNAVTQRRIENAKFYDGAFADLFEFVKLPPRRSDVKQIFHTYVIQVKEQRKLVSFLQKKGVETKIHYPIPIHLQKSAEFLDYRRGDFPICEEQADTVLSLPVHQHLAKEELTYVTNCIKEFYKSVV